MSFKERIRDTKLDDSLVEIKSELIRSFERYGDFTSLHEGYAILLEEVDELWDEIKKKQTNRDYTKISEEAQQVAAMALKIKLIADKQLNR